MGERPVHHVPKCAITTLVGEWLNMKGRGLTMEKGRWWRFSWWRRHDWDNWRWFSRWQEGKGDPVLDGITGVG